MHGQPLTLCNTFQERVRAAVPLKAKQEQKKLILKRNTAAASFAYGQALYFQMSE